MKSFGLTMTLMCDYQITKLPKRPKFGLLQTCKTPGWTAAALLGKARGMTMVFLLGWTLAVQRGVQCGKNPGHSVQNPHFRG